MNLGCAWLRILIELVPNIFCINWNKQCSKNVCYVYVYNAKIELVFTRFAIHSIDNKPYQSHLKYFVCSTWLIYSLDACYSSSWKCRLNTNNRCFLANQKKKQYEFSKRLWQNRNFVDIPYILCGWAPTTEPWLHESNNLHLKIFLIGRNHFERNSKLQW